LDARTLVIESQLRVPTGDVQIVRLNHVTAEEKLFARKDVFWVDLCLTPRRPNARARFADRWSAHRFVGMGSLMALPPRFNLHLKLEAGRHVSLICGLQAAAVQRWLPPDFQWTDRRLEACLDISSTSIRGLMLKLFQELRHPGVGGEELAEALMCQLSVEIARYLLATGEPTELGGLAAWRLRVIDKRMAQAGEPPTLAELASLCDISVRQLTRGFRTSRGCTIRDYLGQSRIEAAKRRLGTDESLKSIATSLGFSSQSTFTYAFRQATGVTPRDFRQRILRAVRGGAVTR
jgi:AraC family transcriptional regulator